MQLFVGPPFETQHLHYVINLYRLDLLPPDTTWTQILQSLLLFNVITAQYEVFIHVNIFSLPPAHLAPGFP